MNTDDEDEINITHVDHDKNNTGALLKTLQRELERVFLLNEDAYKTFLKSVGGLLHILVYH